MQEVGKKKTERLQKAFLCSTLMKSYAFVVMLLPSCDVKVIAPFVVGVLIYEKKDAIEGMRKR